LPSPYVYRQAWKRALARVLDFLGWLWLAPPSQAIDWKRVKRVAVLRLDHLGDVLHAAPAMTALKKALPRAQLDFFVGPWGREIASLSVPADKLVVVDAPWFERPPRRRGNLKAIFGLGRRLREGNYDLVIELRGEARHMAASWLSGAPLRLGHAMTAGSFFLSHAFAVEHGQHEAERNLSLLRRAGLKIPAGNFRVLLNVPAAAKAEALALAKKLRLPRRFVAVQAPCGSQAKRWMPERWAELIDQLPMPAVLLGSAAEVPEMKALASLCKKKPKIAAGQLSLGALAAFLEMPQALLSVDSGPAQLAAALGTPLLALYSATNRLAQWGPRAGRKQMTVIQKEVPCGPCELAHCPYQNECMRRIGVGEALRAAKALL
jgi:ADP-heptose:LPS heptosyltransferase